MQYLKDDPSLCQVALAPPRPITQLPPAGTTLGRMARTYNAIGGLIDKLAAVTAIDPMAALSVWQIESGAYPYVAGKPVLRFENHKFWKYWGAANPAKFDKHFRFGGHGAPGNSYQNHAFRNPATSPWRGFHGGPQDKEYEVFDFACQLAGKEPACLSSSFGGPQIMGFNHRSCGYPSAAALFDQFAASRRWEVLGFFDFCRTQGLLHEIQTKDWSDFAERYNGSAEPYGTNLRKAYAEKAAFDALPR